MTSASSPVASLHNSAAAAASPQHTTASTAKPTGRSSCRTRSSSPRRAPLGMHHRRGVCVHLLRSCLLLLKRRLYGSHHRCGHHFSVGADDHRPLSSSLDEHRTLGCHDHHLLGLELLDLGLGLAGHGGCHGDGLGLLHGLLLGDELRLLGERLAFLVDIGDACLLLGHGLRLDGDGLDVVGWSVGRGRRRADGGGLLFVGHVVYVCDRVLVVTRRWLSVNENLDL
ncbi:hypothetical protein V8F20_007963 [Naviculisporaceae sp. PSN 640]